MIIFTVLSVALISYLANQFGDKLEEDGESLPTIICGMFATYVVGFSIAITCYIFYELVPFVIIAILFAFMLKRYGKTE